MTNAKIARHTGEIIHRWSMDGKGAQCGSTPLPGYTVALSRSGVGITCGSCEYKPPREEIWATIEAAAARGRARVSA